MCAAQRMGRACVLLLVVGGFLAEGRGANPTQQGADRRQQPAAEARPGAAIKCEAPGVSVEKSLLRDAYHKGASEPVPFAPPLVRAPAGKQFLFVLISAEFPKGRSWDVSAFRLQDDSHQQYPVKGFDLAAGRSDDSDLAYLASVGALAESRSEQKPAVIQVNVNPAIPRVPQRITFPFNVWPGGSDRLWLMFEIPKPAPALVFHRDASASPAEEERNWQALLGAIPRKSVVDGYAPRIWTDSTRKYMVRAALVGAEDGGVRLKKEDGNTVTVPIEKLSKADQEFLRTMGVTVGSEGQSGLGEASTTAPETTIPESLRAQADKAFREGKLLFIWDTEDAKLLTLTPEEPMVQRTIGYAFSPNAKPMRFVVRATVERWRGGIRDTTGIIVDGPVQPRPTGLVKVPVIAMWSDTLWSMPRAEVEGLKGTVTFAVAPVGTRSSDESFKRLSNEIQVPFTGHTTDAPTPPPVNLVPPGAIR